MPRYKSLRAVYQQPFTEHTWLDVYDNSPKEIRDAMDLIVKRFTEGGVAVRLGDKSAKELAVALLAFLIEKATVISRRRQIPLSEAWIEVMDNAPYIGEPHKKPEVVAYIYVRKNTTNECIVAIPINRFDKEHIRRTCLNLIINLDPGFYIDDSDAQRMRKSIYG